MSELGKPFLNKSDKKIKNRFDVKKQHVDKQEIEIWLKQKTRARMNYE